MIEQDDLRDLTMAIVLGGIMAKVAHSAMTPSSIHAAVSLAMKVADVAMQERYKQAEVVQ